MIPVALTPEAYISGWNQMLQQPPDVLGFAGFLPDTLVASQLAKVQQLHIPAAQETTAGGEVPSAVDACLSCAPEFGEDGKLMADVVAANAGSATDVAFVTDPPAKGPWKPIQADFTQEMKSVDPGSSVAVVSASQSMPASQIAALIVSYVRSHPQVKYLVFAVANMDVGVPEALESLGLANKVKIVSRAPTLTDIKDVATGRVFAIVADEDQEAVWRVIDALARLSEGEKLTDASPIGWHEIITKANADPGSYLRPRGFPDASWRPWRVE